METNIAGHEGVGKVIGGKLSDSIRYEVCHVEVWEVGKGVGQGMMGKLVGVKWLFSACGECEICPIRYCHCPHQKNSGRVSRSYI